MVIEDFRKTISTYNCPGPHRSGGRLRAPLFPSCRRVRSVSLTNFRKDQRSNTTCFRIRKTQRLPRSLSAVSPQVFVEGFGFFLLDCSFVCSCVSTFVKYASAYAPHIPRAQAEESGWQRSLPARAAVLLLIPREHHESRIRSEMYHTKKPALTDALFVPGSAVVSLGDTDLAFGQSNARYSVYGFLDNPINGCRFPASSWVQVLFKHQHSRSI